MVEHNFFSINICILTALWCLVDIKIFAVFEKRMETPNTVRFLQNSSWLSKILKYPFKEWKCNL